MSDQPLISVIVPVYNVEKYVGRCVASILSQTYRNLEVILVNDGSTDDSLSVCRDFAEKDPRIVLIDQENGGLSDARNTGIEAAEGAYLSFVDSDDSVHPQMIECLWQQMERYGADLSVCGYERVPEQALKDRENREGPAGDPARDEVWTDGREPDDRAAVEGTDFRTASDPARGKEMIAEVAVFSREEAAGRLFDPALETTFTVAWNKLYRKELFDGIRYPSGRIHEDLFTTCKLILRADRVVYTDRILYYYLLREESIMRQAFSEKQFDRVLGGKARADDLIAAGMWEEKAVLSYLGYFRNYLTDFRRHFPEKRRALAEYKKQMRAEYRSYRKYLGLKSRCKACCYLRIPQLYLFLSRKLRVRT